MTKEKWVEIMDKAGFSDEGKQRWHRTFEQADPEEHEKLLWRLEIPGVEIRKIRERSGK